MARNVRVYGLGKEEVGYVDRPPLQRAEFRLPPDIHIRGVQMGADFLEVTMRLPLPNDGEWPDWCHEAWCPVPDHHRAKALDEAEFAQYLDEGDDD